MAYDHTHYEVPLPAAATGVPQVDLTSTGDKARWNPGLVPHIIRGVSIALNAAPGDAGVIKGDIRPTFSSDTGRGDGDAFIINLATSHAQGNVVYKTGLSVKINPGQELVVEATDASASVTAAKITLYVEPSWEIPGNFTAMKATT